MSVGELRDLVAAFRAELEHLQRKGTYALPSASACSEEPARSSAAKPAASGAEPARALAAKPAASGAESARSSGGEGGLSSGNETLEEIRAALGNCQRCKLAATRQRIAFGVGSAKARLLFVGEAPGAEEDRRGEPFVGRAGQLLDKMIAAMGWSRSSVYIANVLKCRPPGNRDPEADEVASCEPFLARQIAAIAPSIIVTLGKPAAQLLLDTRAPIGALRGKWHEYRGIRVMPTYHPAFLLRSPERKREAWGDLQLVMAALGELGMEAPEPADLA